MGDGAPSVARSLDTGSMYLRNAIDRAALRVRLEMQGAAKRRTLLAVILL